MANDKTEQARQGVENLKIRAKEKKDDEDVQETKEEAKSTVKNVIEKASDRVLDRLDDAKVQIEQAKREKELDRAIGDPAAVDILNQPVPLVTPTTHTSPIPFTTTTTSSSYTLHAPSSPSILNMSADKHFGYTGTPFNAAAHHLPSDSTQFSPHFAGPSFASSSSPHAPSYSTATVNTSVLGSDTNPHNESAWVAAKPHDLEETKSSTSDYPSL